MLGLSLAACGQSPTQPQVGQVKPTQPTFSILTHARPVPRFVGQAVGLERQYSLGKLDANEVQNLTGHSLLFKDVNGDDFVQLIVAGPRQADDIWAFGEGITGDEAKRQPGEWFTSIVGASTARDILSFHAEDTGLLKNLMDTARSLGGVANIARFVAFSSTQLTLQDKAGKYWPLGATQPFPDGTVKQATDRYNALVRANDSAELAASLDRQWQQIMDVADAPPAAEPAEPVNAQAISPEANNTAKAQALVDGQGNLDFRKAAQTLRTQTRPAQFWKTDVSTTKDRVTAQNEYHDQSCWYFLGAKICGSDRYRGFMPGELLQLPGGFAQEKWMYNNSYPTTVKSWANLPDCSNGAPHADGVLGCAPSSFLGMVYWLWRYEHANFYNMPFNNTTDPVYTKDTAGDVKRNAKSYLSTTPMGRLAAQQPSGRALIQDYMDTCFFANGGLTYMGKFVNGANRWFNEQASAYNVKRYQLIGFGRAAYGLDDVVPYVNQTYPMADTIRDGVGRRMMPTIGIYPIVGPDVRFGSITQQFAQGFHYSPIVSYFVEYSWGRANTWITTVDHPYEINITDPWILFSGAYSVTAGNAASLKTRANYRFVFDPTAYRAFNDDLVQANMDNAQLETHYLNSGVYEGRRASWVFDPNTYRKYNADLANLNNLDLITHYLDRGVNEGRRASAAFDPGSYRALNDDLANLSNTGLIDHYLNTGRFEGRMASVNFVPSSYRGYSDLSSFPNDKLLWHYLKHGIYEGRASSPVFAPGEYQSYYADLDQFTSEDLAMHYLLNGIKEGRKASPTFDLAAYRQYNPDLANYDNAYLVRHYLKLGMKEGRRATF